VSAEESRTRVRARARMRAAIGVAALLLGGGCERAAQDAQTSSNAAAGAPYAPSEPEWWARDPRLEHLLAPCTKWEHYDVDTSNVDAILRHMLLKGDRDALRRAREEIALRGAAGTALIGSIVDAYLVDPDGYGPLRNAVDVLQRSNSPGAREVLLRLLDAPYEGVLVQAVTALGKHGQPQDLERAISVLERVSAENKTNLATAIHPIDPARVDLMYLDWMEAGEAQMLWDSFAQAIARSGDARVARRAIELRPKLPERYHALLAAPAARAGEAAALEFLRSELRSDAPWRRELATAALAAAGMPDELASVAADDPLPPLRLRAINLLSPSSPKLTEVLRQGCLSHDPTLASTCLNILIAKGDTAACDRALEWLATGSPELLGLAMTALQPALSRDAELAARALDVLSRRTGAEGAASLAERVSILESIARIPLPEAARMLRERARTEGGLVKGLPARRYLLRLVGNLGENGQRLAAAELAQTSDPQLRLDLLETLTVSRSGFAANEVLRLVEDGALAPHELLFCAEQLTLLTTVEQAAPVLKRAVLRVEQPQVRVALQCLMWRAYPGPR